MTTDSDALLGTVTRLRAQTRRDRHGYALPLLLFGALIAVAPVLYSPAPTFLVDGYVMSGMPQTGFLPFGYGGGIQVAHPALIGWYWAIGIAACSALSVWGYRQRAIRRGVETGVEGYLITAVTALVGLAFGVPALLVVTQFGLYSEPELNLPILFGSAAVCAAAFWRAARRTGTVRVVAGIVGAVALAIAMASIGVYMVNGFTPLLVISAALLVLAVLERSWLLLLVGVLHTALALVANLRFTLVGLIGSASIDQPQLYVLEQLGLPAAVLLLGALTAWIAHRG
jgi:hypothetical protein